MKMHYSNKFKYEVSVIVADYKPVLEKLLFTLDSIIEQKNIKIQIIVTDDGSENNYFVELRDYFSQRSFEDYILIEHKSNMGTVKNIYDGVTKAKGEYIKTISPGDAFIGYNALADWYMYIKRNDCTWSFCDAIYYRKNQRNEIVPIKDRAHPQLINSYNKHQWYQCRWNYVVLEDIALGAATLCEKEIMKSYLEQILQNVKYAEDNIYRIMMFDGIVGGYFSKALIIYEVGEGISTSGDKLWSERLHLDWKKSDEIILERKEGLDKFQIKMKRAIEKKYLLNKKMYMFQKYFIKRKIYILLKERFNARRSPSEIPTLDLICGMQQKD